MAAKNISRSQARRILTRLRNELEGGGDVSHLNITAMMDMMSILLVFMLMQFAAEQAAMQTSDNLVLANSNAPLKPIPSLNVTISTTAIIVEGDAVAAVRQGANGLSAVDPSVKRDGPNEFIFPQASTIRFDSTARARPTSTSRSASARTSASAPAWHASR